MTCEAKLRTLASANTTLQGHLGTAPFRWYDTQAVQGTAFPAVRVQRISTIRMYEHTHGLMRLSQPRFQIDVLHPNPETARAVAKDVVAFLGTINLVTDQQFGSPPTTPTSAPCTVLNERDAMDYRTDPPVFVRMTDVRIYNLEEQ